MTVLIVGGGGREHALAWKLAGSTRVTELFCAPGNPGIGELADLVPISSTDLAAIEKFVRANAVDLVVIGPEDPLAMGLADRLRTGERIGVHCRGSIGRSTVTAACALIHLGWQPQAALEAIAAARGCAVPDTEEQRRWILSYEAKP